MYKSNGKSRVLLPKDACSGLFVVAPVSSAATRVHEKEVSLTMMKKSLRGAGDKSGIQVSIANSSRRTPQLHFMQLATQTLCIFCRLAD